MWEVLVAHLTQVIWKSHERQVSWAQLPVVETTFNNRNHPRIKQKKISWLFPQEKRRIFPSLPQKKILYQTRTGWWFPPLWRILYSQNGNLPQIGLKIQNIWKPPPRQEYTNLPSIARHWWYKFLQGLAYRNHRDFPNLQVKPGEVGRFDEVVFFFFGGIFVGKIRD